MERNSTDKKQLILIFSCLIGTFLISWLVRVQPDITYALGDVNAYATLGDACIYASVLLLGVPWGVIVSAAGAALADLAAGSKLFIIGSLLTKSLMALFVAAFAAQCDNWKRSFAVAGVTEAIMVIGFFIYDLLIVREFRIIGFVFLLQLAQGIVCCAVGAVILRYLPPMDPRTLLKVRRSREE